MIHCDECGVYFEVQTDSYTCPLCGTENYPDDSSHSQSFEPGSCGRIAPTDVYGVPSFAEAQGNHGSG